MAWTSFLKPDWHEFGAFFLSLLLKYWNYIKAPIYPAGLWIFSLNTVSIIFVIINRVLIYYNGVVQKFRIVPDTYILNVTILFIFLETGFLCSFLNVVFIEKINE